MSIARLPNCGWRLRLGVLTLLLILTLLYWKYNSYGLIQPLYKSNPVGFAATQPYVLVSSNYSSLGQLAAGVGTLLPSQVESDPWCQKWAVVAPVDSEWVSEAVFRQARMYGWCLVVIFEKEPSKTYDPRWLPGQGNDIVYLTPANQKRLRNSELVNALPWNSIGRKIIGYIYAITHGATIIWDFDDDNMLKFWIQGAAPPGAPSLDACLPTSDHMEVLDPYPVLGAPSLPSWPRGLPLEDALREECSGAQLRPLQVPSKSIAVFQSLSDRQPDADVVYQSIMPFPFYFKKPDNMTPVVVPWSVMHGSIQQACNPSL